MFSKVKQMSANTVETSTSDSNTIGKKRGAEKLSTEQVSVPVKKKKQGPYMPYEFDGTEISIVMEKSRSGELLPKVKIAGKEDSQYVTQFNTPIMKIIYNDLKEGGDSHNVKFGKSAINYDYNVKSGKGVSDKVLRSMPNEAERQEAFFQWAETTCEALLSKAFETKGCMENHKKKAKKNAKKNKSEEKDEFMKGANLSMFKDTTIDDETVDLFVCKRRGSYKDESGVTTDNRPVFWKRTREGFEKMEVKYVGMGSELKYQVSFRLYSTPTMYGVGCDLGKNICIVSLKKKAAVSTEPYVPYFD